MKQSTTDKIYSIVRNEKLLDHILYLRNRWQSEKKFEDFKDYEANMKVATEKQPCSFIKGTIRPFGFVAEVDEIKIKFFIVVKGNKVGFSAVTLS